MSRGSWLKAGIRDQKHLLGLNRGSAYLDIALLLVLALMGSQPFSSEREVPLQRSLQRV